MKTKQERHEELAAIGEENQTDEEMTEQTQLFYELNSEDWRGSKTPEQHYGVDTSMYE